MVGRKGFILGIVWGLAACQGAPNTVNAPSSSSAESDPNGAGTPPVLGGTPSTSVIAGQPYNFQPTAAAASSLTFSIANSPPWAFFSSATGQLYGTPTLAQAGTYSDIVISAATAEAAASLPPFSITVESSPPGTATLVWEAPTQNTNGTPLTDLLGYHVYYGASESALAQSIDVDDPSATTYVITGLSSGTYYFAVSAFNSLGFDSELSNIATKTL